MGHWEQIGEEGRRAPPTPRWRIIAAGIVIGLGTALAYAALVLPLWAYLSR
jgi:hypothetical protein